MATNLVHRPINGPVYVTKYALTTGILEIHGEEWAEFYEDEQGDYVNGEFVVKPDEEPTSVYLSHPWALRKECFLSLEDAKRHVEKMVDKRIASLQKQIGKLSDYRPKVVVRPVKEE